MGMTVCYTQVNPSLLNTLREIKEPEEMLEALESLEEEVECCYLDKMWDGLHCFLTGTSASTPKENDPLSEAVLGKEIFFEDEEADYMAYMMPEDVKKAAKALDAVDLEQRKATFSPKEYHEKEIYPDIWLKEDHDSLLEELVENFKGLTEFYRATAKNGKGIIVSIY
ncbi:MAG: YfbM family protein [Clostridium sp.]|uniref:YfbM family protein n=1 Tax=Clostridium sp. TaxID=1506 RepID=UPI00291510CC|nr:YfbM family protein [Clostridium sp.]MDU7337993.1 YfbM family protein [Clostridium sp.]